MKKISDFNSATEKYPVIYAGSATRPEFVDMPTTLQQQEGVAPMDTLPAQWWNAMWKLATKDINAFRDYVGDAFTEINNLLTKFGITLEDADSEQLYDFFHNDYVQNYLNGIFVNKSGDNTINGDLHIKGSLSVDGIGEEIISTELKVGANTITLRNGNPSALGNTELAGVVTKNYDGNNHNNIISIDKNGVARTGDIDIATRILFSNNGTNFFTDEDLTIGATIGENEELRDTGNQTSSGVKIYEGITYSNNDTQPLATREENPVDGALMKWDAATKKLVSADIEHNGIFRGKCLNGNPATMYPILPIGNTKYLPGGGYTIEQVLANIAAGNFTDIYPGDYFIDSNNKVYRIAGLDTEWNKGDTHLTSHHAVIVTDFALTNMGWNPTDTTAGGYQGSDVQSYCDSEARSAIESVFGAAHVLTVRDLLSSDMDASVASPGYSGWHGVASSWEWSSHKVRLMSEVEVYGARVWSGGYDIGTANEQFPLFRLMPQLATGLHYAYWLSGIASAVLACIVSNDGAATIDNTSIALGVRVRFLLG